MKIQKLKAHLLILSFLNLNACHSALEQSAENAKKQKSAHYDSNTHSGSNKDSGSNKNSDSNKDSHTVNQKSASNFTTNNACIELIKSFEGVRYQAYKGPAGHWLIGYGHKEGVSADMKITRQQAEDHLKQDLKLIERQVANMVKVDVTENQFSALVCLAYNIGWGKLSKSTVLKKLNTHQPNQAANAFLSWRKVNGKVNKHLEARRALERDIFLTP